MTGTEEELGVTSPLSAPSVAQNNATAKPSGLNVENIRKVRDHIAGLPPERFDMVNPLTPNHCGSAACIGGWVNAVCGAHGAHGMANAADLLGLSWKRGAPLFYPSITDDGNDPFLSTPADAVRVLDHFLATGEVDWSIIDTPVEA